MPDKGSSLVRAKTFPDSVLCAMLRAGSPVATPRPPSGEEIESADGVISGCGELERAGLLEELRSDRRARRCTMAAEFLPHDGPLSEAAIERFRCYLAGDRDMADENRAAYRELAAAGLMAAGNTFPGRR